MEKNYEWVKECYYRVSAKAMIRDKDWRFALAKEDTGYWDIPGGGVDHWEEIHDALKREIMEEMWLTVTNISNQPIYTFLAESSGIASPKRPICLLIYEVEVENFDFTPSNECIELWFFTAEEALKIKLYYPNEKVMREIQKSEV